MKKFLILIPLLFASFALKAGDWGQGFAVVLTNGQSYITKDESSPFEFGWCQGKKGSVSIPVWYESAFLRAKRNLKSIGAIITGEGKYEGWYLLYLDPINIASIDLIGEGWFIDYAPRHYDHNRLLEIACLPSDYGKPVEVPEPPSFPVPPAVQTYDVLLAYGETSVYFDATDVKIGVNSVEVFFENEKEFKKAWKNVEKTTQIPRIPNEKTLSLEFTFVHLTEVWKDGNLIYENKPVIEPPVIDIPVDTVPEPPVIAIPVDTVPKDTTVVNEPVVDEPKEPVIDEPVIVEETIRHPGIIDKMGNHEKKPRAKKTGK